MLFEPTDTDGFVVDIAHEMGESEPPHPEAYEYGMVRLIATIATGNAKGKAEVKLTNGPAEQATTNQFFKIDYLVSNGISLSRDKIGLLIGY